ncbi:hypothetical protein AB0H47_17785 [Streptomyces globisporus]|uniref:hypothetical protein n=1 Tax=Streptomyces globisporus TaxID=1908 RepID=UPI003460DEFE
MARKKAALTVRRTREAARRTATAQRIGPARPEHRAIGSPSFRSAFSPPGTFHTDRDSPVRTDPEVMAQVTDHRGANSV